MGLSIEKIEKMAEKRDIKGLLKVLKEPQEDFIIAAISALSKLQNNTIIPNLIEQLRPQNPSIRKAAITALSYYNTPEVITALVGLFNDPDPITGKLATQAVHSIGSPAVPQLLSALANLTSRIYENAAFAISDIKHPQVGPALLEAVRTHGMSMYSNALRSVRLNLEYFPADTLKNLLGDTNREVRQIAIILLGELKDPSSIQNFIPLIKDTGDPRDIPSRLFAAKALHSLAWNPDSLRNQVIFYLLLEIQGLTGFRNRIPTDQAGLTALSDALADSSPQLNLKAAELICTLNSPSAIPALCSIYKRPDLTLQREALTNLANYRDPQILPLLLDAMRSSNSQLKIIAENQLSKYNDPQFIPIICSSLSGYPNPAGRKALQMLLSFSDPTIFSPLRELLKQPTVEHKDQELIYLCFRNLYRGWKQPELIHLFLSGLTEAHYTVEPTVKSFFEAYSDAPVVNAVADYFKSHLSSDIFLILEKWYERKALPGIQFMQLIKTVPMIGGDTWNDGPKLLTHIKDVIQAVKLREPNIVADIQEWEKQFSQLSFCSCNDHCGDHCGDFVSCPTDYGGYACGGTCYKY